MGQRIVLSCEKCDRQQTMSVGGGLMSNNPDVIASCLNNEETAEWRRLYQNKKISSFRAEQKVFYCDRCKELSCLLSVDIQLTDGKKITLGNKCSKCRKELQEIEWQNHAVCPVCNQCSLDWRQVGYWD